MSRIACGACAAGFTLLEILVAMLVMGLIVLASGLMYQSGANAYQRGMERTDITLVGRSLVQMIAVELSMAVAAGADAASIDGATPPPSKPFEFELLGPPADYDSIEFARFAPSDDDEIPASRRGIIRVRYRKPPVPAIGVVERRLTYYKDDAYLIEEDETVVLADRVVKLKFEPSPEWVPPGATNLPEYVDIFVDVLTEEDALRKQTQNARTYHRRVYMRNRNRYL